jgi:hypothetical protein
MLVKHSLSPGDTSLSSQVSLGRHSRERCALIARAVTDFHATDTAMETRDGHVCFAVVAKKYLADVVLTW